MGTCSPTPRSSLPSVISVYLMLHDITTCDARNTGGSKDLGTRLDVVALPDPFADFVAMKNN